MSNAMPILWYGMVWHGMVWCSMAWQGMAWFGVVQYGMAWDGMVWYMPTFQPLELVLSTLDISSSTSSKAPGNAEQAPAELCHGQ